MPAPFNVSTSNVMNSMVLPQLSQHCHRTLSRHTAIEDHASTKTVDREGFAKNSCSSRFIADIHH